MQLQDFDVQHFLSEYWQKKPLLIKNPWKAWLNPLEPDDLAGLACEQGVESRLVLMESGALALEHGPLAEERFASLGKNPWTLLVQAVDHFVPEVAELLEAFRFIPNWRVDDVMVSYAADGGGVGPHYDQYDVFLIQGLGRRRWQIGALCDADTPLALHDELRLLADFVPMQEWVLDPGDILYVPPRVAHNGVAVGDDCMTYSIGFRAPSRHELVTNYCDHLLDTLDEDDRYGDPELATQSNPGEIVPAAISALHHMVMESLQDKELFARWLGQYSSEPKYPETDWRPEISVDAERICALLASETPLIRNAASRFAFIRSDGNVLLFIDGEILECADETQALAEALCQQSRMILNPQLALSSAAAQLLAKLCNQGSVSFEEEPE